MCLGCLCEVGFRAVRSKEEGKLRGQAQANWQHWLPPVAQPALGMDLARMRRQRLGSAGLASATHGAVRGQSLPLNNSTWWQPRMGADNNLRWIYHTRLCVCTMQLPPAAPASSPGLRRAQTAGRLH